MAAGYWGSNYWNANYWHATYWAAPGDEGTAGDYWHENYWNANYWHINYWAKVNTGDVNQFATPNLELTPIVPTVNIELNVQPDTEALPLVTFQADANFDIDPAVSTASLPLNAFDVSVGLEGYQLGDIDLSFVPDSAITVTYGVFASLEAIPLVGQQPSIDVGDLTVAQGATVSLDLTSYVTDSRLDIEVEPLPASLALTGYDTTAGIGTQVPATLAALNFATATHTVEATEAYADLFPLPVHIGAFTTFEAGVVASNFLFKPESTFGDYGALIVNANAEALSINNYEVCARTGFKVPAGTLVKDGYGELVRPESRDSRHPQDFVKSRPDRSTGSRRPENPDRFIGQDAPEVSASDL